jgi:hypothetical protein
MIQTIYSNKTIASLKCDVCLDTSTNPWPEIPQIHSTIMIEMIAFMINHQLCIVERSK